MMNGCGMMCALMWLAGIAVLILVVVVIMRVIKKG
jgi:hypothetical protein